MGVHALFGAVVFGAFVPCEAGPWTWLLRGRGEFVVAVLLPLVEELRGDWTGSERGAFARERRRCRPKSALLTL